MIQMNLFDNDFKEIFSSQLISLIGGLIAGSILAFYTNQILLLPGMLIILPGFLEMRGNISGTFASRLTAGLFLGFVKPTLKETRIIKGNVIASFALAIFASLILGLTAFLFNYFLLGIIMKKIILIPLIAGIIANLIEIPLTLIATFYLFKKGHDPNNFMGPFVTSTADITSIISILIAMAVL